MPDDGQAHQRVGVSGASLKHLERGGRLGDRLLCHPLVGVAGQAGQQLRRALGMSGCPHTDASIAGVGHLLPLFDLSMPIPGRRKPRLAHQINVPTGRVGEERLPTGTLLPTRSILIGPTRNTHVVFVPW